MKKVIIFDWSGVVKDAVISHLWIVNRIFEQLGANKISLEELKENWEQPYDLFYKKYLPTIDIEEEQKAYKEAIFDKDCPKSKSFPEIVELIKKLKEKGFFLVVVSSDFSETVSMEIKEYGLENIFDEIITDVHHKFEAVSGILNKYKFNLENTFFIGDSNHEIDVSKEAGIKSIAVTWGFCTETKLKKGNPDYIAHSVKELEDILLK